MFKCSLFHAARPLRRESTDLGPRRLVPRQLGLLVFPLHTRYSSAGVAVWYCGYDAGGGSGITFGGFSWRESYLGRAHKFVYLETLCTLRALVPSGCSHAWHCGPREVSIPRTRARRIPLLARRSCPGSISNLPELRRVRYVLSEFDRGCGLDSPWRLTRIASPLLTRISPSIGWPQCHFGCSLWVLFSME